MSDQSTTYESGSIFESHPAYGRYVAHHTSRRIWLLMRAGIIYALAVVILQLLTFNLPDDPARIILTLAYGLLAAALLWYVLHLWNREIILYEKGFTYRQGSRLGQFRYADIDHIYQDMQTHSWFGFIKRQHYDYDMVTIHDEALSIDNVYSDPHKLINRLDAYTTRDRMPNVLHQLQQGQSIIVGDFRLTETTMSVDGQTVDWAQIKGWTVQQGTLIIRTDQNPAWYQRSIPEVDNVMLLIALLKHLTPPTAESRTEQETP